MTARNGIIRNARIAKKVVSFNLFCHFESIGDRLFYYLILQMVSKQHFHLCGGLQIFSAAVAHPLFFSYQFLSINTKQSIVSVNILTISKVGVVCRDYFYS